MKLYLRTLIANCVPVSVTHPNTSEKVPSPSFWRLSTILYNTPTTGHFLIYHAWCLTAVRISWQEGVPVFDHTAPGLCLVG